MSNAQEAQLLASHVQRVGRRPIVLSARVALALLFILAFLHGTLYAIFLPPWGLIDEAQHLHYIQYIAEHQSLPVAGELYLSQEIVDSLFATHRWETFHWTPPPAPNPQVMGLEGHSYEAYQPPLFYLAMAPLYSLLPQDMLVKVYALRMVVVLLSLITVWALYRTVALILPKFPQLAFLAGLLLIAIPERAIATSRINNDVLLEIVAALFFMVLTHAAVAGLTMRRSLLLGLLLGLGVWVKTPAAFLIIPLLLLIWLHYLDQQRERRWGRLTSWLLIAAPLGAAMAARNLWLYGDLTGFAAFDQLHRLAAVDGSFNGFVRTLVSVPNHLWLVWWKGSEVGTNRLLAAFYALMALVVAGAFGGLFVHFRRQHRTQETDTTFIVALLAAVTVLIYALAIIASYYQGMVPVIQGRFLLPAIVPFVLLLAWGLWLYPYGERIILAVVVLLWGMGLLSLFGNLVPYFYYWQEAIQREIAGNSLSLWQQGMLVYQHILMDKPALLGPLLLALPICYGAVLLWTLVFAVRTIPPRQRFAAATLVPPFPNPFASWVLPKQLIGSTLNLDALAAYLLPVSIAYLALPHLLFYFGWLRWLWAILATASLCLALVITTRVMVLSLSQGSDESQNKPRFTRQNAWMIGAICLLWLVLAGIGGILRQDYDWDKHNVMLNSLIAKPWPTVYEIYKEKLPLIYYVGYYLPPALVGKVAGWIGANITLTVWSLAGLLMAVAWFCILVRRVSFSVLLAFVFFSGLDLVGWYFAAYDGIWSAGKASWYHIEPWTGLWQYSSNTTLLFWVPHQALSGWIITGIIVYCLVILRRRDLILLPAGLSAFWSPFITIGIIPYLVIDFSIDKEPLWLRIRRMITLPNLVGLLAIAITAFYLSARARLGSPVIVANNFSGWSLPTYEGPIYMALAFLILFCFLEFGILVLILYGSGAVRDPRWRWMLHITVFTLCLLPWFKFGAFNDLVMRASIPALFVLAVIVTQVLHDRLAPGWARGALLIMLLVGAATPLVEFARHLERMWLYPPPLIDETQTPRDFLDYFRTDTFFFSQYTGSVETPFFAYAAKAVPDNLDMETNDHDYVLYDNKIYLLRDEVSLPSAIAAGATMTTPLQVNFYGISIRSDYNPSARLVGEDGKVIWGIENWPGGRPTTHPFHVTEWSDTLTMTVPITATSGLYHLEIGFFDANTKEYLPAHSVPDELPLGDMVTVGSLQAIRSKEDAEE